MRQILKKCRKAVNSVGHTKQALLLRTGQKAEGRLAALLKREVQIQNGKKHKHWSNITVVQPDRPGELDGIVLVKSFRRTDHIPFMKKELRARGVSDEEINKLKGIQSFKKYLRDICLNGADNVLSMGTDNPIEDALQIKRIGEKKSRSGM